MKAVSWLPPQAQEWVDLYGYFLEGVWTRFEKDGEWPNPVEVQRELRSADPSRRVNQALDRMPPLFARREYAPPRLALTVFGLGCCEGARPLLEQYLTVAKLALQRFDSPTLPNRLRREEVVAELNLSPVEADRLSAVLSQYALFLGSGDLSIENGDREIHPQAEEFEGVEDVDDLLEFLARKQRLAELGHSSPVPFALVAPQAPSPPPPPPPPSNTYDEKLKLGASMTSAAAAAATVGLMVASAPSVLGLALVGLFGGLAAALLLLRKRPASAAALVVALVLIGGGAGSVLESDGPAGSFQYFVASTGDAAVIIPVIEPSDGAAMSRDHVLGSGSSVQVACTLINAEGQWAKLTDGTFVRAGLLAPEVGGDAAPDC
jgi:hypothetical protein